MKKSILELLRDDKVREEICLAAKLLVDHVCDEQFDDILADAYDACIGTDRGENERALLEEHVIGEAVIREFVHQMTEMAGTP